MARYWLVTGWQFDRKGDSRLVQTRCYSQADAIRVGTSLMRSALDIGKGTTAANVTINPPNEQ